MSQSRDYLVIQAKLEDDENGISEADRLMEKLEFIAGLFPGLNHDEMLNSLTMSELNDIVGQVCV